MADVGKIAKDAGYVLLGMAIIRVQQAQVRRRELEREIGDRLGQVGSVLPPPVRGLIDRKR